MANKFSAYLSIYNDWDILPAALRSVASHVDELVIVDGAYEWMVPYLKMLGIDSTRSDPRVYAAIEASGIPFRVISRTWKNEVEKRQSGYAACAHDYIYRVDADEVIFFDDNVLAAALSQGLAVGEMSMPNYVAPGWISRATNLPHIERQCFLFDRRQVSSELHLNYLWLILTADKLPLAGSRPFPVYPEPLAFNSHLTAWRTPRTGVNRAAFYMLNWMRQNGVPWLAELRDKPLTDLQVLFDIVEPNAFLSSLSRGRIAFGMIESPTERTFTPTPLTADQEATFTGVYETFLRSLVEMNIQATAEDQAFLTCQPTLLDLSTPAAHGAIAPGGTVSLRFSVPLVSAKAQLITYAASQPENEVRDLTAKVNGTDMEVELPVGRLDGSPILRQCLEFHVWPNSPELSQRFRVLK
jgi:hypothetical protein